MKTNFFLILIILALTSSCLTRQKEVKFTYHSFKDSVLLKNGTVYKNDSLALPEAKYLRFHPDSFLLISVEDSKLLRIVDLKTKSVQKLIPRGEGHGELITATDFEILNRDVYVFDPLLSKIIKLSLNNNREFFVANEFLIDEKGSIRFFPLKENYFMCLSKMGDDKRLTFFDQNGKNITKVGDYPPFLNDKEIKGNNGVFESFITASPNGNTFVLAEPSVDIIEIHKLNNGLVKRLHGPSGINIKIAKHYSGSDFGYHSIPTFTAYCLTCSNGNEFWVGYIGTMYNKEKINSLGDTAPTQILCFGWDGKPLRRFILESPSFGFDCDWKNQILYTLLVDHEEVSLVSYSLKNL
jgi:hypothetical protein